MSFQDQNDNNFIAAGIVSIMGYTFEDHPGVAAIFQDPGGY